MSAAVLGVGMSRFGRQPERDDLDLAVDAARQALEHAGLGLRDVEALFFGSIRSGPGAGQRLGAALGLSRLPVVNVNNACATSTTALREAMAWIGAGEIDVALCVGVEVMSRGMSGPLAVDTSDPAGGAGYVLPGEYALRGTRYLQETGATRDDFASVTVKNRRHAALNPRAHFQSEVTLAEVLASPMIVEPLTLFQCCPKSDGASAAVAGSVRAARRATGPPVWIRASQMGAGGLRDRTDVARDTTADLAAKAYEQAGIAPEEVDVAEVQDPFTIAEVVYTESLGLVPRGEGAQRAARGETALGGRAATVNPDGGLLARGHPLGATGLAQVAEIVWQLRGEAGARQIDGASVALQHSAGLSVFDLELDACFVQLFTR